MKIHLVFCLCLLNNTHKQSLGSACLSTCKMGVDGREWRENESQLDL